MKNQSCWKEIPHKKKLEFLAHAISVYEAWDKFHPNDEDWGWQGICIVFKEWANIREYQRTRQMFPELMDEIDVLKARTGEHSVIEWKDTYACKGRIKLLKRVLKQIS